MFIASVGIKDEEAKFKKVKTVLEMLPRGYIVVLLYLLSFLRRVCDKSKKNMMTATNLAIVFSPSLLRSIIVDMSIVLEDTTHATKLMTMFIEQHEKLFSDFNLLPLSRKEKVEQPPPLPKEPLPPIPLRSVSQPEMTSDEDPVISVHSQTINIASDANLTSEGSLPYKQKLRTYDSPKTRRKGASAIMKSFAEDKETKKPPEPKLPGKLDRSAFMMFEKGGNANEASSNIASPSDSSGSSPVTNSPSTSTSESSSPRARSTSTSSLNSELHPSPSLQKEQEEEEPTTEDQQLHARRIKLAKRAAYSSGNPRMKSTSVKQMFKNSDV